MEGLLEWMGWDGIGVGLGLLRCVSHADLFDSSLNFIWYIFVGF